MYCKDFDGGFICGYSRNMKRKNYVSVTKKEPLFIYGGSYQFSSIKLFDNQELFG